MKRFISALLVGLMALSFTPSETKAQGVDLTNTLSATFSNVLDTVTSTTAHYMVTRQIKGLYKEFFVVASATEISGTTTGTVSLEASQDNVKWYPYYNSMDSTYVLTLDDQTGAQNYRWKLSNFGDGYLRVKAVGGGTVNYTISAKYTAKGKL
jgi:hypothetical protein